MKVPVPGFAEGRDAAHVLTHPYRSHTVMLSAPATAHNSILRVYNRDGPPLLQLALRAEVDRCGKGYPVLPSQK